MDLGAITQSLAVTEVGVFYNVVGQTTCTAMAV